MTILAFDTSGNACSAAIWRDGGIAAHRRETMDRGHTEALMPMVLEVLRDAGRGFDALDWLAVTVGPGSFTGVRAGLAAARGIALARSLPALGIDTFATVLWGVDHAAPDAAPDEDNGADRRLRVIALDSRHKEVYLRIFSPVGVPLTEPDMVAPNDIAELIGDRPIMLAGSAVHDRGHDRGHDLETVLRDAGVDVLAVPGHAAPDAGDLACVAADRIAAREVGEDLPALAPLYLQPPYALTPAAGGRLRP